MCCAGNVKNTSGSQAFEETTEDSANIFTGQHLTISGGI